MLEGVDLEIAREERMGCPSLEWSTLLWQGLRSQFNKPKFSDLKVNVQVIYWDRTMYNIYCAALV